MCKSLLCKTMTGIRKRASKNCSIDAIASVFQFTFGGNVFCAFSRPQTDTLFVYWQNLFAVYRRVTFLYLKVVMVIGLSGVQFGL